MSDRINYNRFSASMHCLHRVVLWGFIVSLFPVVLHADTTYTFTPSAALIMNPERGLYYARTLEDGANFDNIRALGSSLCYANIMLGSYRSSKIPETRLQEIDAAFSRMRAAGLKCIFRINYNEDISGSDATLNWMETHLQQLQPVLEKNSDLIAFVQAGMIGAWGEWHASSSGHDTPKNRAAVYDLLVKYLPPAKFIQIRTPEFVNDLVRLDRKPLNDKEAFSGTARARIAYHNDAWLASANDLGTYPSDSYEMEKLKKGIENHTKYAPWGGETAGLDPQYVQPKHALTEAARFHATYLNATYNPDVINEFIKNDCWDDFKRKLGYRIELVSATLPDSIGANRPFSYRIQLKNSGWAPFYNPRPVVLRVLSGSDVVQQILLKTDPRFWRPESGEIVLSGVDSSAVSIPPDRLGFALWLPDPSKDLRVDARYSVQFANDNVWDSIHGHNYLKRPASNPAGSSVAIIIDGAFEDWVQREITIVDPVGDSGQALADVRAIWVAHDHDYIYLRVQTSRAVDWSSTKNHFLFNLDGNRFNNYKGSEIMFEGGKGFDNRGGFVAGGAINGLNFTVAPTGATADVEMRIPRSPSITYADGTSVFPESLSHFELGFEGLNPDWVAEELVPYTQYDFK